MAAVYVSNLVINTGTTFEQTFTLEDSESATLLDLTGYTVKSTMRKHPDSSAKTDFTASIPNPTTGVIKVGLTSTASSDLKGGRYMYDIIVIDGANTVTRVVEGSVMVRAGVTTHG